MSWPASFVVGVAAEGTLEGGEGAALEVFDGVFGAVHEGCGFGDGPVEDDAEAEDFALVFGEVLECPGEVAPKVDVGCWVVLGEGACEVGGVEVFGWVAAGALFGAFAGEVAGDAEEPGLDGDATVFEGWGAGVGDFEDLGGEVFGFLGVGELEAEVAVDGAVVGFEEGFPGGRIAPGGTSGELGIGWVTSWRWVMGAILRFAHGGVHFTDGAGQVKGDVALLLEGLRWVAFRAWCGTRWASRRCGCGGIRW